MSGSSFTPLFNLGPTICGQILGKQYQHYRPTGPTSPLSSGNILPPLNAWITGDKRGMGTLSPDFGDPKWYALLDPTLTAVGDYIVGPLGTFFIAAQDVPAPIMIIHCNKTITMTHPRTLGIMGKQPVYGTDLKTSEVTLATGWPCALVQGTKGEAGPAKLPGDVRLPWYAIFLPIMPGVTMRNDMILTDSDGIRYITSSTELTPLGWRVSATIATN